MVPLVVYSQLVYLGIDCLWKLIKPRRTAVKLHSLLRSWESFLSLCQGTLGKVQPIVSSVSALLLKSSAAFWNTFCDLLSVQGQAHSIPSFASSLARNSFKGIRQLHTTRHTISLFCLTPSLVSVTAALYVPPLDGLAKLLCGPRTVREN